MSLEQLLTAKLAKRRDDGSLRSLKVVSNLVDFCSNDYLGLAQSPELHQKILQRVEKLPVKNGATGSRLLSGNSAYAEEVEAKLSRIFKGNSALIFNSGYAANIAVISAIPQKGDTILYDELSHASIKDGARLSLATRHSFRHNDLNDLEQKLKRARGKKIIVVESVYSMDGDIAPLRELTSLAREHDASIILDEAHSTGSYGENGSGLAIDLNVHDNIEVRIYTFGKAMGIHGACVIGSDALRQYLINFARPFIYTTALPTYSLAAIEEAFLHLRINSHLQTTLQEKIQYFISHRNGVSSLPSTTAIQTFLIPGNEQATHLAQQLQGEGFDARAILSPTVPKGSERLRICLHTYNSNEEIARICSTVNRLSQ